MDRTRRLAGVITLAVVGAVLAACEEGAGGVVVGSNQPPDPQFTVTPASPSINDEATFDASGSTDPDGSIVEYRWDFDGDTIYETSGVDTVVTHSYATAGDREVVLQLLDNAGDTASVARTITVIDNLPPRAAFAYTPASPGVDEAVTFDASASDDTDGTVVEYRWDFDGDGAFESTGATSVAVHSFDAGGEHLVTLEIADDDGATDSATRAVDIAGNQSPSAAFTFSPASPAASETVTFDASASDDPDGTVVEYRWDFDDDGTFDVSQASPTTTHAFAAGGDHIVTLQVVDDDGATGESSRTVAVGG